MRTGTLKMSPILQHLIPQFYMVMRMLRKNNDLRNNFCRSLHILTVIFRGPERIRTAVGAFAELSLATRPQDLFNFSSYC